MNTHTKVTNVVVDSRTHALIQEQKHDALAGAKAAGLVHVAKDHQCPHCGGELVVVEYRSDGLRRVECPDDEVGIWVNRDEVVPA